MKKRLLPLLLVAVLLVAQLQLLSQPATAAEDRNDYMSFQEAGSFLRSYMTQRRTDEITIQFHLAMDKPLTDAEIHHLLQAEAHKHTGVGKEGDTLQWSVGQVGYIVTDDFDGKNHYITYNQYLISYYTDAAQEAELDAKVAQILDALQLSGKSDYEKIVAIYDYVCNNVVYSEYLNSDQFDPETPRGRYIYSAYGALVKGESVCQGFSGAMYRLLLEAGIDNRLISGDEHGWNIVKLGDRYYALDATWDSDAVRQGSEPQWFLKGSSDFWDYGHTPYAKQNTAEFRAQYPMAILSYGAEPSITASGSCGANATYTLTEDGTLTISGTGALEDMARYSKHWAHSYAYIKKVVIEEGITAIGTDAFYNCQALTSVSLPSTLTAIGNEAFGMCTSLTSIHIPDSVTSIGNGAFIHCWSLKDITLPSGMTVIGGQTFAHCMELEQITLPEGITTIGAYAFGTCPSLSAFTIPNTVTTLGDAAFAGSFDPAKKVSLTLPESITTVGTACFENCGLNTVIWNAATEVVPAYSFNLSFYLQRVVFSDTIIRFEEKVFHDCSSLKDVVLPKNLQELGDEAFFNCRGLERMQLPASLKALPHSTFLWCVSLKELTLPEGIATIGHHAFEHCEALQELQIPASVQSVEDYAFACSGITDIHFEGDMPQMNPLAFGAMSVETCLVHYPEGNTTWTPDALQEFTSNIWNLQFSDGSTPPETEPPTTEPPATEPPVTEPPATEPPATEPPVTEPPATEPPVTEPPATEPPATEPKPTEPPVTDPAPTVPVPTEPGTTAPTQIPREDPSTLWIGLPIIVIVGGTAAIILLRRKKA